MIQQALELLTAATMLLTAIAGTPNLPQSFIDQATATANYAITYAQTTLQNEVGQTIAPTVLIAETNTPTQTQDIVTFRISSEGQGEDTEGGVTYKTVRLFFDYFKNNELVTIGKIGANPTYEVYFNQQLQTPLSSDIRLNRYEVGNFPKKITNGWDFTPKKNGDYRIVFSLEGATTEFTKTITGI